LFRREEGEEAEERFFSDIKVEGSIHGGEELIRGNLMRGGGREE